MDRLDAAGLSWKLYAKATNIWGICPTFFECWGSSQRQKMVSVGSILTDAAGTLPAFSIVLPTGPTGKTSQHIGSSMKLGDNWIGQMVSAIEHGPNWSSTAIFLAYDDCGCFYDHIAPPAGLGIRVPMVIASPFAKPGFTDSGTASFASLLAFTEHLFGLAPLTTTDASAYDYANSFNFTQAPLGPVPMTQTPLSTASQHWLATHPTSDNDDNT